MRQSSQGGPVSHTSWKRGRIPHWRVKEDRLLAPSLTLCADCLPFSIQSFVNHSKVILGNLSRVLGDSKLVLLRKIRYTHEAGK